MFKETKIGNATMYHHEESGKEFCRFFGGVVWPAAGSPAFSLIVGEKWEFDRRERLPLYVFHETHERSLQKLVNTCAVLGDMYPIDRWIAECEGEWEPYQRFFQDFKDAQRKKDAKSKLKFNFYPPTLPPDDFSLTHQLWDRRLRENGLVLKRGGILEGQQEAASRDDSEHKVLIERYRELLLLGALVWEFDNSPFPDPFKPPYRRRRPPSWRAA
jgi:hypothetical protein